MDPLLFPVQGRFVVQTMRIQSLKLLFPDAHINRYQENLKVLPLTNYLKSFSSQKVLIFPRKYVNIIPATKMGLDKGQEGCYDWQDEFGRTGSCGQA